MNNTEKIKAPNRTRKYKTYYYVLFVIAILMCASFGVVVCVDAYLSGREAQMKEGADYTSEKTTITDKEEQHSTSVTVWEPYFIYIVPKTSDRYFLIDGNNRRIPCGQAAYDSVSEGDIIDIFTVDGKTYYTSAVEAWRSSLPGWLEGIFFFFILAPVFGLLLFVFLLVLRNKMLNPYYNNHR